MNALLETKNLTKTYTLDKDNEITVLKDVDLHVERGEFISVMGPSGSGKSTLLYNISGMDHMTAGSVRFNGLELSALREKELAQIRLNDMGFVFQQINLLKNLSILDNIILSGYASKCRGREATNERAMELMERTGIASLANNTITQASGGQLQRVGICRALINEPAIVFGDEPTGALNSRASSEIMDLLTEINRAGTTVLLVTHDVTVAARTDRVLLMVDGKIVSEKHLGRFSGDRNDAIAREEVLSTWLFKADV